MSKLIKFVLPPVVAVCALCYFYAPARLAAMVLLGRSPVCPMARAIHSDDELRTQIANKDHILSASKLLEKDPAGYHLWDTPHGRFWIPQGSDYVLPFNLAEQERKIYGVGEQDVHAGDIVLDCGANVGVYTREALKNGAKLVVSIEPAPENIECLRRNFAPEIAAGRVILYPKGVWDKDEMLVMRVDPDNSAADSFIIRRPGAVETKQLPLTTVDKLVAELKLERVDFIKMDIEGAEQRALQGARETLARYHPRMALAAYHVPSDPEMMPQLVRQAWPNYRMQCGPCAEANGHVRPDVLYFQAP
jgi:FkbM family methyltransferase